MSVQQKQRSISPLPETIPLFPLPGALLLPGAQLPLNIFEPRYLSMVDDALAGARLIGMIQPLEPENAQPRLYDVGCAGRLTSFNETDDGRYLITLTGIHRFRVDRELASDTPYRQAQADWRAFDIDAGPDNSGDDIDRETFLEVMQEYLSAEGLKADLTIAAAPTDALVASLAMGCPFAPNEKQALLEAKTVASRAECLVALMEMSQTNEPGGDQMLQ